MAAEVYLEPDRDRAALVELERVGAAEPVCGVWAAGEDIRALVDGPEPLEPSV